MSEESGPRVHILLTSLALARCNEEELNLEITLPILYRSYHRCCDMTSLYLLWFTPHTPYIPTLSLSISQYIMMTHFFASLTIHILFSYNSLSYSYVAHLPIFSIQFTHRVLPLSPPLDVPLRPPFNVSLQLHDPSLHTSSPPSFSFTPFCKTPFYTTTYTIPFLTVHTLPGNRIASCRWLLEKTQWSVQTFFLPSLSLISSHRSLCSRSTYASVRSVNRFFL